MCGKSGCLQSSVYIVNEFHPHIGFVVCYPLNKEILCTPTGFPWVEEIGLKTNEASGPVSQ